MSEHITHEAIAQDCIRLALHSRKICEAFKICLKKHPDCARLGSFTSGGDPNTVALLRDCRERWPNRKDGDLVEEKLTFVLGWRFHNAADREFKPVYREVEPEYFSKETKETGGDDDLRGPCESSIYHDAATFREVFQSGKTGPLPPEVLAYSLHADQIESLFGGLIQRSLFALQNSTLREENPAKRLGLSTRRHQRFGVDLRRYSNAYYKPEPNKIRRFTIDSNFYDRKDPIIALARSIQRGAPDKRFDADTATGQSYYAQALRKAHMYLLAASEYFERRIVEKELGERLDLATKHI